MENGAASTREECGESVEKSIGGRRISLFREFANEYEEIPLRIPIALLLLSRARFAAAVVPSTRRARLARVIGATVTRGS